MYFSIVKYYVFKRTSTGGSDHPFNIGTSHRYNIADSNGIKVTFTSTSTSSDYVDNSGVQSILDGEELSFYIPESYIGTLKYYSYSKSSKIESFTINPICSLTNGKFQGSDCKPFKIIIIKTK